MLPLILMSNDDGVSSDHLRSFADALTATGKVETLIVAPERQRSAASHAITLHKPLRLNEVAPRVYSLSGTPVDCVYVGLLRVAPRRPALVISGINDGFNLGTDVFYSGTFAAAAEGGIRGVPGIAYSLDPRQKDAAEVIPFCVSLALAAIAHGLPPQTVLNVNLTGAGNGYRWTHLGHRYYKDDVTERLDPRGKPYYWIGGGVGGHREDPGSDCDTVSEGIHSVSPLHLDLTSRPILDGAPLWAVEGAVLC